MPEHNVPPIDFQIIVNAMPGNHVILLPDAPIFTIVGATDAFLQTSYTIREQIIGKPLLEVFSNNFIDKKATSATNLLTSLNYVVDHREAHQMADLSYNITNPHTGAFEHKVWAASNVPILNEEGVIQYIIHTTEDITEKVRLQEENTHKVRQLNDSERRFRSMVEQVHIPILLSRGEDVIIESLNAPMLKAMDKTSFDDVLGKKMIEALPELKDQPVLQVVINVQKTGIPYYGEEQQVDLFFNGKLERRYFNFSYTPIIEGDNITGVLHVAEDITQQVEARKRIEKANEELQFVTDTMPQLVWAAEANGSSYFFNKGWLAYTGLTLEEVKGNGWTQSLHPDDLDRTLQTWTRAFKEGVNYEMEYRLKRYDGAYHWYLARGIPMKDKQGQILKWYGTCTDIDEQKRSTEVLLQITERFNLVSKATQDVIWDWDLFTDKVVWNEGVQKLFGYPFDEKEKQAHWWYDRVHPQDREPAVQALKKVFEEGSISCTREYRFLCADGSYKIVLDRGFIQRDKNGRPIRMLGSMQDITDRKQMEEALRESEERFRTMANTVSQSIWITDAEGRIEFLNKHWRDYCGELYSETTALDLSVKHLHPEDAHNVMQAFQEAMQTGEPWEVEQRNLSKEGEYRWFLNRATPYKDPYTGKVMKWFGVGIDIHDRKLEKLALERSEEELEKKVQQRTLELENANQELQRSNTHLGEFAHAASHDLKEPIRKIQTFASRLKDTLEARMDEKESDVFQRMQSATQRMALLIDDLLAYSQVSAIPFQMESVNLNEKIQVVLTDLEVQIEEKRAVINIENLPTVKGYKRQLQQLFQNLIGNALKYSKKDVPPQITIRSEVRSGVEVQEHLPTARPDSTYHLIAVEDNGIGFDQQYAERIFSMFQRLHGKKEYEGTGIGLSIVRKVVDNHNGYIWAESKLGKGSTFKLLLPVANDKSTS